MATSLTFTDVVSQYARAEAAGTGAFNKLSLLCAAVLMQDSYKGMTAAKQSEALKNVLKSEEDTYKKESKLTSFPTAYRSGKSAVLAAVEAGVPLVDEAGKPVGKTALEKATKEAREEAGGGKTELEKLTHVMGTAYAILGKITDKAQLDGAKSLIVQLAQLHAELDSASKAE